MYLRRRREWYLKKKVEWEMPFIEVPHQTASIQQGLEEYLNTRKLFPLDFEKEIQVAF